MYKFKLFCFRVLRFFFLHRSRGFLVSVGDIYDIANFSKDVVSHQIRPLLINEQQMMYDLSLNLEQQLLIGIC